MLLTLSALAKDKAATFTISAPRADVLAAVRSEFVAGGFTVTESAPDTLTMERHIDASLRGNERVQFDFSGDKVITVHAWIGVRSSITPGC